MSDTASLDLRNVEEAEGTVAVPAGQTAPRARRVVVDLAPDVRASGTPFSP